MVLFWGTPFTFGEGTIFVNYKHGLATQTRSGMGKQTRRPAFFGNPFEAGKCGFASHQAVDGVACESLPRPVLPSGLS